jgi:uncharacterized protein YbaR (Trm112 family)
MAPILAQALLEILVCPVCHQALTAGPSDDSHAWLHCAGCGRYYPVEDGIAIMLEHRASAELPRE